MVAKLLPLLLGDLLAISDKTRALLTGDDGSVESLPTFHGASTQRWGDGDGAAGSSALTQAPRRLTEKATKLTDEVGELAVADKEGDVRKAQLRRLRSMRR